MALFKRKEKGVLDLTEKYRRDQERAMERKSKETEGSESAAGFLGDLAHGVTKDSNSDTEYIDISAGEDRIKKLVKRLMDMTNKIEDLSNQIYHLQQRVEVLERKAGVKFSG